MNDRIPTLLYKSINDTALDEAEKKELDDWMALSPHYRSTFEEISHEEKLSGEIKELLRDDIDLPYKIIQLFLNTEIKIV